MPKIKGYIGEKTIAAILTRLDPQKYKVINDVMLEINGKTSQIDHVVMSNYGIFVTETKNYKGWILGDEYSQYWTQVIYKRKEKFYNPIRQNYGHVQALKKHLQEYPNILYIPIIVFSIRADLKVKTTTEVVYSSRLLKTIRKYDTEVISDADAESIYLKVVSLNINTKVAKKEHVKTILQSKKEKVKLISNNICPKCGGQLVVRKGKHGSFVGCTNYPKCKFTKTA